MAFVNTENTPRQNWMNLLARAKLDVLEKVWADMVDKPNYEILRAPQTGMVMVRARAGGEGQRFNLGEMTVTRCTVRLHKAIIGHAYIAGRNKRKATLGAIFDAMFQDKDVLKNFQTILLDPIQEDLTTQQNEMDRKVAATRVNFFTMVRGDD